MSYSDNNTFEKILDRCLSNKAIETVDKRPGSIIYDALAPVCLELAEAYVKMDILEEQTFLLTATGNNLDKRAYDYGISRENATKALRIGEFKQYQLDSSNNIIYFNPDTWDIYDYERYPDGTLKYFNSSGNCYDWERYSDGEIIYFDENGKNFDEYGNRIDENHGTPRLSKNKLTEGELKISNIPCTKITGVPKLIDIDIPEDSRFTSASDSQLIFKYIGKIEGNNILECETSGTIGNLPSGTILPINSIDKLIKADIISTYIPGQDEEDDDSLRKRIVDSLNYASFGGNINDYIEKVNAIDGVGNTKVFPAWQYNGSVLLSIVDPLFNPITEEFAKNLKEQIDPEDSTGSGVGIAPIGHYVTITTPIKQYIDVKLKVELVATETIETMQESIENKIEEYFESVRKLFSQDVNLTIYRARIIEKVLELPEILNVSDVRLNDKFTDITIVDEGLLNKQYLPYVKGVIIE